MLWSCFNKLEANKDHNKQTKKQSPVKARHTPNTDNKEQGLTDALIVFSCTDNLLKVLFNRNYCNEKKLIQCNIENTAKRVFFSLQLYTTSQL